MKQIAHCKPWLYLKIAETTINQQISVQKAHNVPLSPRNRNNSNFN